jgi:hypothetical protein
LTLTDSAHMFKLILDEDSTDPHALAVQEYLQKGGKREKRKKKKRRPSNKKYKYYYKCLYHLS